MLAEPWKDRRPWKLALILCGGVEQLRSMKASLRARENRCSMRSEAEKHERRAALRIRSPHGEIETAEG